MDRFQTEKKNRVFDRFGKRHFVVDCDKKKNNIYDVSFNYS